MPLSKNEIFIISLFHNSEHIEFYFKMSCQFSTNKVRNLIMLETHEIVSTQRGYNQFHYLSQRKIYFIKSKRFALDLLISRGTSELTQQFIQH